MEEELVQQTQSALEQTQLNQEKNTTQQQTQEDIQSQPPEVKQKEEVQDSQKQNNQAQEKVDQAKQNDNKINPALVPSVAWNQGFKLHVIIRLDLGMTKGKICAQAGHAVLGMYKDLIDQDPVLFAQWSSVDFAQQTYAAHSLSDLEGAAEKAESIGLKSYVVYDAGRTQIARYSGTVCSIGPCETIEALSILDKFQILE